MYGEASFIVTVYAKSKSKVGWYVNPSFQICLHSRYFLLLQKVQSFFGGIGSLRISSDGQKPIFSVVRLEDLINILIPHFIKYPLITHKQSDFKLFKLIIDLINRKKHLTPKGLQKILNLKAGRSPGLSDTLKAGFPNTRSVKRPRVKNKQIIKPNLRLYNRGWVF